MLASTVQFSRYGWARLPLAPTWCDLRGSSRSDGPSGRFNRPEVELSPDPSGPNSVPCGGACVAATVPAPRGVLGRALLRCHHVDVPSMSSRRPAFEADTSYGQLESCQVLLRKEVIQPHLPVRLPCYDFVPIASPTFDGSLHKGWATGFGCCRLS